MRAPSPLVSVLMPVYNAGRYLCEALDSIAGQSVADWECVVVDDGSDDESPELLAQRAGRDGRFRLIRSSANHGIVDALNRGLAACGGRYIARMDADDIAMPDRIARQLAAMEADPGIVALGGRLRYMTEDGRDMGVERSCALGGSYLRASPLLHPTVMMRMDALRQHGLRYMEKYRYAEDYYLWLQLARHGRLSALEEVVLHYRVSPGASRVKNLRAMIKAMLRVKRDAMVRLGYRPSCGDIARFMGEAALLAFPARLVWAVYNRLALRGGVQ